MELDSLEWLIDLSDTEPAPVLVSALEQLSSLPITSSCLDIPELCYVLPAPLVFPSTKPVSSPSTNPMSLIMLPLSILVF